MIEYLVAFLIAGIYLSFLMGIVFFLAFVCRVGDLGIWFLGWIDRKIQEL